MDAVTSQTTDATASLTINSSDQGLASFTRSSGTMSGDYISYVNTAALTDSDQKVTFTANTTGTYFSLIARQNTSSNSYYLARAYVDGTGKYLTICKCVSGTVSVLATVASNVTISSGTTYNMRFQCLTSGSTTDLNADIWSATANEPTTTWTLSTTDSTFQGVSGYSGMRYDLKSATSGTQTFTVDNYQAVNAASSSPTYLDTFQSDTLNGSAAGWTVGAGTWSVASDAYSQRYHLSTNPGGSNNLLGAYSMVNSPSSVGDFTFTCEAIAGSSTGNYAVVFGYQNSTNYYYMNFSGVSGATALYKVVNGVASVVTGGTVSGTIIANTSAHEIKITRIGQAISVWYDGEQAPEQRAGQHVHRRPDRPGRPDRHRLLRQRDGWITGPIRPRAASHTRPSAKLRERLRVRSYYAALTGRAAGQNRRALS